jgi:hypothetical protein
VYWTGSPFATLRERGREGASTRSATSGIVPLLAAWRRDRALEGGCRFAARIASAQDRVQTPAGGIGS